MERVTVQEVMSAVSQEWGSSEVFLGEIEGEAMFAFLKSMTMRGGLPLYDLQFEYDEAFYSVSFFTSLLSGIISDEDSEYFLALLQSSDIPHDEELLGMFHEATRELESELPAEILLD